MKITELRSGQGSVEVEGVITELGDTRAFNKYGKELKVANAILKDDSGAIKLTLWNDDVMRFKQGDKIKIINGYVSEFQGEKQLTSGKFGRMEKVGDGENQIVDSTETIKEPKKAATKREAKKKNEETSEVYSEEVEEESNSMDEPIEEEMF